jgi:rubrerythrin
VPRAEPLSAVSSADASCAASHGFAAHLEVLSMPKNHARKKELADLKNTFGVRHHDAIAIFDDPRRDELRQVLIDYSDIRTYAAAVEVLELPHPHYMYELGVDEPDEPKEYICDHCGFFGAGFHCCECGADHEYRCAC